MKVESEEVLTFNIRYYTQRSIISAIIGIAVILFLLTAFFSLALSGILATIWMSGSALLLYAFGVEIINMESSIIILDGSNKHIKINNKRFNFDDINGYRYISGSTESLILHVSPKRKFEFSSVSSLKSHDEFKKFVLSSTKIFSDNGIPDKSIGIKEVIAFYLIVFFLIIMLIIIFRNGYNKNPSVIASLLIFIPIILTLGVKVSNKKIK